MKKVLLLLLLVLTLVRAEDPYKNLQHYTLENGLNVYLLPDNKSKNIDIIADVGVGMGVESDETAGLSHLVEHIVFRDSRIKDRDFYNLFKDAGATFVNGYTQYYKTQYLVTIKPEKGYWVVENFAKMFFDKNVTDEDLRVERGALQIEIGEPTWLDTIFPDGNTLFELSQKISNLFPPSVADVWEGGFGIDRELGRPHYRGSSIYRTNNKKFTLKQVLKHFHEYYYPSNITLKIVGKFDPNKMREVIQKSFGNVARREGKSISEPIIKDAKLDDKPFILYEGGTNNNPTVSFGAKLLQDDPKKMVVLKAYMDSLADRLNKLFRNKQGETYGVGGYVMSYRNAAIAQVRFSSPHDAFEKNLKTAQALLKKEANGDINDSIIQEAITQKRNKYDAKEHDVETLMDSVDQYISYHKFFGEGVKTPYQLLDEITPEFFRQVLKATFVPKHAYLFKQKDYVVFPYEGVVLELVLAFFSIYMLIKFLSTPIRYERVRFKFRLINIFISIFVIFSIIFLSELVLSWLIYLLSKVGLAPQRWVGAFDIPLSYIFMIADLLLSIVIMYFLIKTLYRWFYTKALITNEHLVLYGAKSKKIPLATIDSVDVVPFSPKLCRKKLGNALLFWRPLLKLVLNSGEELYLRSFRAKHIAHELKDVIGSQI